MGKIAHKLVVEVARQMAGAIYDEAAKNNAWYALNPSRRNFVQRVAPDLLDQSRKTLSEMLGRNDVPEADKAEIYEALMLDRDLPRNVSVH